MRKNQRYGQQVNEVRQAIEGEIESRRELLANEELERQLKVKN